MNETKQAIDKMKARDLIEDLNMSKKDLASYLLKNKKNELRYYKQEKNSGYNIILLYNDNMIACYDFMLNEARNVMTEIKQTNNLNVNCDYKLKVKTLKSIFSNPFDSRKNNCDFKKAPEKTWLVIREILVETGA